jgi:catechol 2,3-dioxygenase-like lactoylglutathione lyase family enzyme
MARFSGAKTEIAMIDHIGLRVKDYEASKAFYLKALAPLGYTLAMEYGKAAGFGKDNKIPFWIGEDAAPGASHVAFAAKDRATVDAFYKAALEAGGRDNGKAGPRPQYHANYYGAFILDPDGNNIEAVCHT